MLNSRKNAFYGIFGSAPTNGVYWFDELMSLLEIRIHQVCKIITVIIYT